MIGGAAGGVVGTPADLCNVRMQNDAKLPLEHRRSYKHAFDGLWKIGTLEGPSALFIGVGPNVQRAVFMTAGQIGSEYWTTQVVVLDMNVESTFFPFQGYDLIKQAMLRSKRFKDDTTTHFVSSLGAGLVATTVRDHFLQHLMVTDYSYSHVGKKVCSPMGKFRAPFVCLRCKIDADMRDLTSFFRRLKNKNYVS